MSHLILKPQNEDVKRNAASMFCAEFCTQSARPKYIFGRNVYTRSVLEHLKIDGVIDDFTSETTFYGAPIRKIKDVEKHALILIAAGGRPLTAKKQLDELGLQNLDYFSFLKYSCLEFLPPVVFNEHFADDFYAHEAEYEWIYGLLADETSRTIFRKLVSFRLNHDLDDLRGFCAREPEQYFEDFLQLAPTGEVFIDVGGFNGYNSLEFIKRCPDYNAIHLFEPEPENYQRCIDALQGRANIYCYPHGLSDKRETLRLEPQGSGSKISATGSIHIKVDRLDDVLRNRCKPTLIKMDIEGAEMQAIEGAKYIIATYQPRLALCVYHNVGDFWRIPRKVLSLRSDYRIYLRHYTESIYETVMFFIPQ
ncbi:FkbM family methyltransferase [Nitrosomonas europaea]|uniref:FkbM family methyltransferase n=1 Tax=Nitrosomonas europaea TaxID=915 RepID=UPI0032663EF4